MTQRFREILIISVSVMAAWAALAVTPESHAQDRGDQSSPIQINTFKTHSRLSVHVDEGVISELQSSPDGFELMLKGIGLGDLGAPLGEEAQWAARYRHLRDPRLASLEFSEVAGGVRVQGRWKFGQGPDAPANPMMEAFDYREKTRSTLVLDFWLKEGLTVGQAKTHAVATRRIASVKKHEDDEKSRAERLQAREKARADAEDPKLFCRTPLAESSDVFLQFQPVHEPVVFTQWFALSSPDADYTYYEPKGKARDAQFVRLALKLYREGSYALVNRTLDFFDQEHPQSSYRSEMRFLRANAYLKLNFTEEASQLLREIQREAKASNVSLQAGMYLALQQLAAKNYLMALESFSWLSDHHGASRKAWIFHLGAAECARNLRQTDRAAQEYQWIAEHAPEKSLQAEGAFRIGDLYLDRYQYDQGLAAYAQAMRHYAAESERFPAVYLNRAESLYGLGQFERANEAYRAFLTSFPAHPGGWRATYRLGEIAARKSGANRENAEARKWYLDTINRYPFSPGATLARLQLLPCGDHAGFSGEAADRFFAIEAEKFDGDGEVSLERYKDFRALSRVRSLMTLGRQEEAVATAIAELRRVPRPEARRWLGHLLVFNFRKSVLELLESGDKLGALTFYQKNSDTVPLSAGSVDPGYLLKLSQAASDLNLGKLAQDVGGVFEKARKSRVANNREIAAVAGESTDPDIKLETSERAFTEAKALWITTGMKAADEVRARLGQVSPESRFSFEREILLGLIEDQGGNPQSALRHAAQAQLLGPRDPRIEAWVASLGARAGDTQAALAAFRTLENQAHPSREAGDAPSVSELLGVPPVPPRDALIRAQCEILEKGGHWGESAANYARAVGNGLGGAEARYGFARALLRAGGRENHGRALATLEAMSAEDAAEAKTVKAAGISKAPTPALAAESARTPATAEDAKARGTKKSAAKPVSEAAKPAAATIAVENEKFWRKLASETLADERAKKGAREGMKQ